MATTGDPLNVHDIQVQEQPFFTPSGAVKTQTVVTFWVGTHGPFRKVYESGAGTSDRIQQDINSQVQMLRLVTGAQYGG